MRIRDELLRFYQTLERSAFIDDWSSKAFADVDSALPIECGQTISQPSLVFRMTELLDLHKTEKVLEVGTGSGYQTAFLSAFANEVYTIERIPLLAQKAMERLKRLGYQNIHYKTGDGSDGWEEHAPYDRIIVTAAAGCVPQPLLRQLAAGGRMVLPAGEQGRQELLLITSDQDGNKTTQRMGAVSFVELVGPYGWKA